MTNNKIHEIQNYKSFRYLPFNFHYIPRTFSSIQNANDMKKNHELSITKKISYNTINSSKHLKILSKEQSKQSTTFL